MGKSTTPPQGMRPYRVVLADDAQDLRFLLSRALQATGRFEVVGVAGTGHEAVAQATREQPDLTLLDLQMPEMDGLEALPLIRAAVPGCAVVVLSGIDAERMAATARLHGAAAYMEKRLSPSGVVAELLQLLDARGLAHASGTTAGADVATAQTELPADLISGRHARRFVAERLGAWALQHLVETAELLTSELVSNAVIHAKSRVAVTLRRNADRIRIEVADSGRGALAFREPSAEDTSGRGLLLIESLAQAWGTSADGDGKLVWFELSTSAS